MKNLFYFVLGLCLIILTSATTVSVMTVKPATPKSVISIYEDADKTNSKILNYCNKGYIVKQLSLSINGSGVRKAMVVMEKY